MGAPCASSWDYEMVGEPPAQRWANVFELSGKRRPLHLGRDLVPQLLELASVPVPLGDLLSFVTPEDLACGVLMHLCWRQAVVFDLDRQARILGEIPAEQVKDGRHGLRQFRRFPGRRWFLAVVAVCQLDDLLARPGAVLPHGELADFLRSGWPSTVR